MQNCNEKDHFSQKLFMLLIQRLVIVVYLNVRAKGRVTTPRKANQSVSGDEFTGYKDSMRNNSLWKQMTSCMFFRGTANPDVVFLGVVVRMEVDEIVFYIFLYGQMRSSHFPLV